MLVNLSCRKDNELNSIWSRKNVTLDWSVLYSDTLHWSDISYICDLITEQDLITAFDAITLFREISIGHLQRVPLANRGHLLFRTPGPVPFGTCICSNVETILSWPCHVYGPFEFWTSLGTLFCSRSFLVSLVLSIHCQPIY